MEIKYKALKDNFYSKEDIKNSNRSLIVFTTGFLACFLCLGFILALFIFTKNTVDSTKAYVYDGKHTVKIWNTPPPHLELASVARYVMHISEWGSLATISTHKIIEGFPFINIFSVSDGPYNNSTGIPYFYLTELNLSVKDLQLNNKTTLIVSESQTDFCAKTHMDPEDPRCAHIMFSGFLKKIDRHSEEGRFAKEALFSRHWEMKNWPQNHKWFFAKLEITHIYVQDFFGPVGTVDVEEYFKTKFPT